jgi:hypothetical protein
VPDLPPDPPSIDQDAAGMTGDLEPGTAPQPVSSSSGLASDFRAWLDEHDAHQLRFWSTSGSFSVFCRTCEGGAEKAE